MPRLARLDAPGVLHHVIGRGIERKEIFLGVKDRNDFLGRQVTIAVSTVQVAAKGEFK